MRKLPYPKIKPNATITLHCDDGLDDATGAHKTLTWTGLAVINEKHTSNQTSEGKHHTGGSSVYIFHDVFPGTPVLVGTAIIDGINRPFEGARLRNPDGSVHHVKLVLK